MPYSRVGVMPELIYSKDAKGSQKSRSKGITMEVCKEILIGSIGVFRMEIVAIRLVHWIPGGVVSLLHYLAFGIDSSHSILDQSRQGFLDAKCLTQKQSCRVFFFNFLFHENLRL